MKNKIIIVTLLLAASLLSKAQLHLGAKVGLNFANVSSSFTATSFNKKIAINGGATLKYNFINTFGVQMDLLYSQMGSLSKKVETMPDGLGGTLTTTTEVVYDFSYLQIPVFANIEFPIKSEKLIPYRYSENIVSIHLIGGGYFGYALANNSATSVKQYLVDVDGNPSTTVLPKVSGASKKFNKIDFGLAFGAGISFNLSKVGKLTVDGRYLMGMANVNSKKAYPDLLKYPEMKNKTVQIQLGYIHRITKPKRWH
ncbi:MAG: porin family protein [Bacteroidia bacterium]